VYVTFYGFDDNDNGTPGHTGVSTISNPVIHQVATEDLGTFAHPSTFATDLRIAAPGTIVYIPKIRKYYIMKTLAANVRQTRTPEGHISIYILAETRLWRASHLSIVKTV